MKNNLEVLAVASDEPLTEIYIKDFNAIYNSIKTPFLGLIISSEDERLFVCLERLKIQLLEKNLRKTPIPTPSPFSP